MSNDYKKLYFKYKNKYINLKNQIGGVTGTDQGKCVVLPDFCDEEIHGENGTQSFFLRDNLGNECAEITLRDENQKLFIADIKVAIRFGNCSYNFKTIMDVIERKAKEKAKNLIILEDNSYMQFPDRYFDSDKALYTWDLAYVKKGGLSFYETFDYQVDMRQGQNEINFLKLLNDLTTEYNRTNSYDLVNEGKKLDLTNLLLTKNIPCTNPSKCYTSREEYTTALEIFEREYNAFNNYLVPKLVKFAEDNEWDINKGSTNRWIIDSGYKPKPTKYHSLIKFLELNEYKKNL